MLDCNPARHIEITGYQQSHARVWTEARVESWEQTGAHPVVQILRIHRHYEQDRKAEAAENGKLWIDSGYVFTRRDGNPISPNYATTRFAILVRRAGLPPVRLLSRPGARFRCCHWSVSPGRSPNPPCRFLGNGLSTVAVVRRVRGGPWGWDLVAPVGVAGDRHTQEIR